MHLLYNLNYLNTLDILQTLCRFLENWSAWISAKTKDVQEGIAKIPHEKFFLGNTPSLSG